MRWSSSGLAVRVSDIVSSKLISDLKLVVSELTFSEVYGNHCISMVSWNLDV